MSQKRNLEIDKEQTIEMKKQHLQKRKEYNKKYYASNKEILKSLTIDMEDELNCNNIENYLLAIKHDHSYSCNVLPTTNSSSYDCPTNNSFTVTNSTLINNTDSINQSLNDN